MSTDQWEAVMQAEDSAVRLESANQHVALSEVKVVSVDKQSLSSSDLLNSGWEGVKGKLVPSPNRDQRLSSIRKYSLHFSNIIPGYMRDDLIQESFLAVVLALPKWQERASLNTYTDRVVKNKLLDLLKESKRDSRLANSNTVPLYLEGNLNYGVEVSDHEADLLKASQSGWNPRMVEEDQVDDLDDDALMALVAKVPDGLAAWWRMVDQESWEVVAERMGVSVRMAQRRVPLAWDQVLAIPEVVAIVTTALKRGM